MTERENSMHDDGSTDTVLADNLIAEQDAPGPLSIALTFLIGATVLGLMVAGILCVGFMSEGYLYDHEPWAFDRDSVLTALKYGLANTFLGAFKLVVYFVAFLIVLMVCWGLGVIVQAIFSSEKPQ